MTSHQDESQGTQPPDLPLPQLEQSASASKTAVMPSSLSVFAGIKTTVKVVAGAADCTVGELLGLKEGAVLQLDRQVDAPFDIVLDGVVLARGQLVAVGEQFGIRVTEVRLPSPL